RLGRRYATNVHHLSYGMVDLPSGKMKSREGTVVDADQLIAEMTRTAAEHTQALGKIDEFTSEEAQKLHKVLALGALKYFLLRVEAKKRLLFDPQASIDFQGHTGPSIQYTYARIAAILRKAQQTGVAYKRMAIDHGRALHPAEQEVIVLLCKFPTRLREAAEAYSPALVAQYAFDLAKAYNKLYAEVPILHDPDIGLKQRKVYLSSVVARTLRTSMGILGITMPERM
ncbi:MAG: DALR anticodon-binding domain-containing protein, partial [Bacteroidota bacterium]